MGSSRTRARTRVSCIGRWILNYCATREARPDGFERNLSSIISAPKSFSFIFELQRTQLLTTGCHYILIPPVHSLTQKPVSQNRHVSLSSVEDGACLIIRIPCSLSLWRMHVFQAFSMENRRECRLRADGIC